MELAVFILLVILVVFFARAYRKINSIEDDVSNIRLVVWNIRKRLEDAEKKEAPEVEAVPENEEMPVTPEHEIAVPVEAVPGPVVDVEPAPITAEIEEPDMAPTCEPKTKTRNFEKIVGENIFGKIGILALVIGIGFFVKYAIDNNWINEVARTILGLLAGFGLWVVAYRLREKYRSFSSVLAGGGFAVCFVTIAVAYNFYRLFPGLVTLIVLVLLSAAMTWMALRYDRRELAMMAVLGGYIAPFLSAGDNGSVVVLLSYTALLSVAAFIISLKRSWWELSVVGSPVVWAIVDVTAIMSDLTIGDNAAILCFSFVFVTLFSLPLATVLKRYPVGNIRSVVLILLMVVNSFAFLWFALSAIESLPFISRMRGIVPAYNAVLYALLYIRFYRGHADAMMQTLLRWAAVGFAALALPVQFSSPSVVAMALGIYSLLLIGAFIYSGRSMFILAFAIVGVFILRYATEAWVSDFPSVASSISLLVCGASYYAVAVITDRKWPLFECIGEKTRYNLYGITLNVGCALISAAVYGYMQSVRGIGYGRSCFGLAMMALIFVDSLYSRKSLYTDVFLPLLGVFAFALLSAIGPQKEAVPMIMHWLSALLLAASIAIFAVRIFRSGPDGYTTRYAVFYGSISAVFIIAFFLSAMECLGLKGYYSAAFSIAVIIAGALLMFAGLRWRVLALRIISLAFFGVLLVKLVAYDLWRLPMVGRIAVFLLLGAVLLCISFLYQKLRAKIFSHDEEN